jgi:2Fe-2S ferredoxin
MDGDPAAGGPRAGSPTGPAPAARELICRSRWPGRPERRVRVGAGVDLFGALRAAGLPIASSCRGDAVCGRCWVEVLEGASALSPPDDDERRLAPEPGQRLACRTTLVADGAAVTTSYW